MPQKREWTVHEIGELISGVQLLRSRTEMASAFSRDPTEIEEKIAELGLATSTSPQEASAKGGARR